MQFTDTKKKKQGRHVELTKRCSKAVSQKSGKEIRHSVPSVPSLDLSPGC